MTVSDDVLYGAAVRFYEKMRTSDIGTVSQHIEQAAGLALFLEEELERQIEEQAREEKK